MEKYLELPVISPCVAINLAIKICLKVQKTFVDELAVSQTTESRIINK